jgi:hypothetical protein
MVLGTNYQSVTAGIAYTRASAFAVENSQKTETLAAINFVKTAALAAITPSTTAYDRISSNFDIVLDIIQNGTSAIPAITYPNPTVIDPNIETAKYQIQNNKEFIKAETLEYIDRNFINFSYNKEKCARDTGLIIDGLVTDLLFPSNGYTQSNFAGLQYWSQSTYVGIIGEELTTTTNAIRFINSLTQEIILNQQVGPRYQGTLTQVINLTPATSTEVNKLENEFDRILYILNTGTVGITDSIVSPGITAVNTNSQYAYNILQANKNYIKSETIAYINDQNPGFAYDTGVCGRDVGFMIDCVSFDILYGGNRQATQAGVYYYDYISTSSVIATELLQTTQTYDRLKEILPKLVTNKSIIASFGNTSTQNTSLTTSTSVQGAQLQAMVSKITAIINNGPSAADAKVAIGLTKSTATNVINAAEIILANKDFLVSEIISYADRSFSGFLYNEVKCYRDTGLIVDSIVQDLLFSTSSQSTFAGLQYWSQDGYVGEIINEVSTTSNIIRYINGLAQEIVQNSTGTRYQSGVQQIISTSTIATTATVNIIDARFTDIDQILLTGIIGITDQIIPNGIVASTSTNIINAYNILQANKYYMVTEGLYKVINDNPSFMFDQNICARDLGFMIDSVCFDLLYGGNKQSIQSGAAYYSYVSTSSVIASETTQTLAAYAYIDSITQSIILGHKIPTVYQTAVSQITNLSTATVTEGTALSGLITNITDIIRDGPSAAAPLRPIRLTRSTNQNVINAAAMLHANRTFIQEEVIAWTNYRFQNLNRDVCARDIGYVLDALTYDLMYSGNSQMFVAGSAYYSGTILSVKDEIVSVLDAYSFINSLTQKIILSQPVTPLQLVQTQDFDAGPATITEVVKVDTLFDLLNDILSNGFTSTITLEETLRTPPAADEVATFYQYSLIVSTGHSFEWIGAGTNIDSALPYLGGTPIVENQGYEINGGRVNFTGTDQRGDFRIGNDLVFNRNNGTISGRTFTKSLFAVMTPYILSIGG